MGSVLSTQYSDNTAPHTTEQFRTYFNSLKAWDKARKLAIAEEKIKIREKALKTKGISPPKESRKAHEAEDEIERIRSLTREQFFEEAKRSGRAIEVKARIFEKDRQDIDGVLDFNFFNGTLMHLAAEFGHTKTITFLLDHGAGTDVENGWGATPLEYAISNDHASTITELLANGASVADAGKHMYLHKTRSKEIALKLLRKGVPIDGKDSRDNTPLHYMASEGRTDVVEALLSWRTPANVNAQNSSGKTPLHEVAKAGAIDTIKALLKHGANLDVCDNNGRTPLSLAIEKGQNAAVAVLLQACAETHGPDDTDWASIASTTAVVEGDVDLLKQLLAYKPDLDKRTSRGRTALHSAAATNKISMVKLLLDNGANPDIPDVEGKTPLYLAEANGHDTVARMLIERGAKHLNRSHTPPPGPDAPVVWQRVLDGKCFIATPLGKFSIDDGKEEGTAIECLQAWHRSKGEGLDDEPGKFDAVDVLKAASFVELKPYAHALENAAIKGHVRAIEGLIQGGADVNHKDERGLTALHVAAVFGQVEAIRTLVRAKADVNVQTPDRWTPLHLAAQEGRVEAIKELIGLGASFDVEDSDGRTPIEIAIQNSHPETAEALMSGHARSDASEGESLLSRLRRFRLTRRS